MCYWERVRSRMCVDKCASARAQSTPTSLWTDLWSYFNGKKAEILGRATACVSECECACVCLCVDDGSEWKRAALWCDGRGSLTMLGGCIDPATWLLDTLLLVRFLKPRAHYVFSVSHRNPFRMWANAHAHA